MHSLATLIICVMPRHLMSGQGVFEDVAKSLQQVWSDLSVNFIYFTHSLEFSFLSCSQQRPFVWIQRCLLPGSAI